MDKNKYIYSILIIRERFTQMYGIHYPSEIITLIMLSLYKSQCKNIKINCGYAHTTLISDDKVYVWGHNSYGQLGLKNITWIDSPQRLSLLGIKFIECGGYHTIALAKNDNTYHWGDALPVYCYGTKSHVFNSNMSAPYVVNLFDIKKISCGKDYTVVVTKSNESYVWGSNMWGQLGLGDLQGHYSPTRLGLENVRSISCGAYHTVALTLGDKTYVWGRNHQGQLGLGDTDKRRVPTKLGLEDKIVAVSSGSNFTTALLKNRKIFVWGDNDAGQLGLGDYRGHLMPQELKFVDVDIVAIRCGDYHSIAMTSNGTLYGWGSNYDNQLGLIGADGINAYKLVPTKIHLPGVRIFDCGGSHNMAVTIYDEVYVWGKNSCGQLGLGDHKTRCIPCQLKFNF